MKIFLNELFSFLKVNYYIPIIGFICFIPILLTQEFNGIFETLIIFSFHLIADILISLMIVLLMKGELFKGYILQLLASLIFGLIGIYSYIFHNNVIYLIPSLIYFPIILNNLYILKFKKKSSFFEIFPLIIYGILLYIYTILTNDLTFGLNIQFIGVLSFAIVLNIKSNSLRNKFGLFSTSLMIFGGLIQLFNDIFINDIINGATFSYTILPLVIFIGFLKNLYNQ